MKSSTRYIFSAAAAPATDGRTIIQLSCKASSLSSHERTMKRMKQHFKSSLMRVLNFAKHETLRKAHRYLHANRELRGQQHPGAVQIVFDPNQLGQDLQSALYGDLPDMLQNAGQSVLDSIDYTDPWMMPSQDVLDYIAQRENLLSDVPDEIYDEITDEISTGLLEGESLAELSNRISTAFDAISDERADVIADNETASAYNYASDNAARAAGVEYKQWVHGSTSKVPRPDHVAIDRLVVPIDEPYPVGDPPLMYPHDENGSPEDVINCSCISIPASTSDYERQ